MGQVAVWLAFGRQLVAGVGTIVLLVAHLAQADTLLSDGTLEFGLITAELLVRTVLAVHDPVTNLRGKKFLRTS